MTDRDDIQYESHDPDPLGILGWIIADKYKLTGYLGSGGFGEVYQGHNVTLVEQRVVIKFLKRTNEWGKFEREAKILSTLSHPNIGGIIDYIPNDKAIVIPFIDGENCDACFSRLGKLPGVLLLRIAQVLTDTLAFAHERKIAHRDIKPGNVMIDKAGHVYLIDFGIAKQIGGTVTKTGYQALTPQFAAPERQHGRSGYNPFLSDLYELGVTLYYLGTGEMPYRSAANPNLRDWGSPNGKRLSSQFLRILKKATHPDPAKRYRSAVEMGRDVAALKTVYRRRNLWRTASLAAAVIVIAGVVLFRGSIPGWWDDLRRSIAPDNPVVTSDALQGDHTDSVPEAIDSVSTQPQATSSSETDRQARVDTDIADEPAPTTTQPPPPPPPTRIKINTIPTAGMSMLVDGNPGRTGRIMEVASGAHTLTLLHPDFPVYRDRASVEDGKLLEMTYDLADLFAAGDTMGFQISAVPRQECAGLRAWFNGTPRDFNTVPVRDFSRIIGRWQLAFAAIDTEGNAVEADSFMVTPGQNQARDMVIGNAGTFVFKRGQWSGKPVARIVVFWTKP